MIIRKSLLALALAASCVLAALPSTMLFQGNMVLDGKSISGSKEMEVSLYDALTAGTEVWTKTYTAMFNNGYYAVELDNLESVDFSKPLFVGLKIGTETIATRIPLTSVPYAKRAAVAESLVGASTIALHGDSKNGAGILSVDSTEGASNYSAYLQLNAKTSSAKIAVSSGNSGATVVFGYAGISFTGTGVQFSKYSSTLVDGSTACTSALSRMVVLANTGTATRGLYVCDSNGSGAYYWYKL